MDAIVPKDLDEEIFNDRVAGLSAREIATKYHVTVPEVNEALDRRAGLITEHERARALSVEIARMDKIYSYFDKRAEGGDAAAGNICIKASERKSALLGLDAPVWTRIDAVARVAKVQLQPSSFDKIRAAIDRLRAEHGKPPVERDDDPPTDQPH